MSFLTFYGTIKDITIYFPATDEDVKNFLREANLLPKDWDDEFESVFDIPIQFESLTVGDFETQEYCDKPYRIGFFDKMALQLGDWANEDALNAVIEQWNLQTAYEHTENDFCFVEANDLEDYGCQLMKETLGVNEDVWANLAPYIDFKTYGRDNLTCYDGDITSYGVIYKY